MIPKEELNFFERNEQQVTVRMCKILLWMTLAFPVLLVCSVTGIFRMTIKEWLFSAIIGSFCTISPTILLKLKVSTGFIKNYCMVTLALTIATLATNYHVGIYLTYPLVVALSCMYFDKKHTQKAAVIGFICMVTAVYIRSGGADLREGETRMHWFIAYTIGYIIEYIAMSAVFISTSNYARMLLEKLQTTEDIEGILTNCENVSISLSNVLGDLNSTIHKTVDNNAQIGIEADKTIDRCRDNLAHIKKTEESIGNMGELIQNINHHAEEMLDISEQSYASTENYIKIIDETVNSIHEIGDSSDKISARIDQVRECSGQISDFAGTIIAIANKTNILSLNASIEAARAGEQGKGFVVVASEVGKLASECQSATQNISALLGEMTKIVEAATHSVEQNRISVESGIQKIARTREEAEKIMSLQNQSTQKVREVEQNLTSSLEHQKNVVTMAQNMDAATNRSLDQAQTIQEALQEQAILEKEMENSFREVQEISDRLLEISKSRTAAG